MGYFKVGTFDVKMLVLYAPVLWKLWWRPALLSSGDYLCDTCSLRLGGARIRLCCTGINSRQMEEWMKLASRSICITSFCFAMMKMVSFNIWAERVFTCTQIIFWHWNLTQGFTCRKPVCEPVFKSDCPCNLTAVAKKQAAFQIVERGILKCKRDTSKQKILYFSREEVSFIQLPTALYSLTPLFMTVENDMAQKKVFHGRKNQRKLGLKPYAIWRALGVTLPQGDVIAEASWEQPNACALNFQSVCMTINNTAWTGSLWIGSAKAHAFYTNSLEC